MKRKAMGKTELMDSRSRFPRLLRPPVEELGRSRSDYQDMQVLFVMMEGLHSGKWKTDYLIQNLGYLIDDMEDGLLDRMITFEGFESRTRQAFLRMIRLAADDFDPLTRMAAYISIGSLGMRECQGIMLERISLEEEYLPFNGALEAARALDREGALESEIKERLLGRLGSSDPSIRSGSISSLRPGDSERLHAAIWKALEDERDPAVIRHMFYTGRWINHTVQDERKHFGQGWIRDTLTGFLNARPELIPVISDVLVPSLIPLIQDIDGFINALAPETRARLHEETDPEYHPRMTLHTTALSKAFLRAALDRSLERVEVLGSVISFCRLPHLNLGSMGRVHHNGIAVAEEVADEMVPIVAYHEYIEGRTGSHEEAKIAEREAVRSLGLEREYAAWLEEIGENDR